MVGYISPQWSAAVFSQGGGVTYNSDAFYTSDTSTTSATTPINWGTITFAQYADIPVQQRSNDLIEYRRYQARMATTQLHVEIVEGQKFVYCYEGCNCSYCTAQRHKQHKVTNSDWRGHRPKPTDWHSLSQRRRKGEKTLLSLMDVNDRIEWFEHKSVRLRYPSNRQPLGINLDYVGRTLYMTPTVFLEFNIRGHCPHVRNIWMQPRGSDERGTDWSWEDQLLALIFYFMSNTTRFIQGIGCRDHCYVDDHRIVKEDYANGTKRRVAAAKVLKAKKLHLSGPFMQDRWLPSAEMTPK